MSDSVTIYEADTITLPRKSYAETRSIAAIAKSIAAMQTINVDGGFQPR